MTDRALPALPLQSPDTPWPTEAWPEGELPKGLDRGRFDALMEHAFQAEAPADLGETHAAVIIQHGRLIHERYWTGFDKDRTCPSWSMAKSITQALVGILAADGRIDIHKPAWAPEWTGDDPRRAITLDLLLRMSSGLRFREDYEPDNPSDVIEMLWGEGKEDVGHFAASFPLEHEPGGFWSYSSGTTNIVARAAAHAADAWGGDFEHFMRERLFDPLGMRSAAPKFDKKGTFIGSSFCFCTPRDFARFGLLYLRDGLWEGKRILPPGWVDYARTKTWQQPNDEGPYGAHWWLDMAGPGSFSANGYEGQYTVVVPELDMVVVRNGKTPGEQKLGPRRWIADIVDCFRQAE
ncbi:CubicO group peptidase (beta-lactamase class C family) [Parvibaculum indicum]|uniref:serine hydrolase domain-containing protein n=1 Tax=Parvibaculum indicum TaxID=562969 RepID=UPI001FEBFCEF|nr:serine hydrolase [Parvibaculum indicum]NIJ42520.1 CubicO group peptidase (beta-lactamase class C family) [Parvibaculum indicum]